MSNSQYKMENKKSQRYTNKKIKNSRSVNERLINIRSQCSINKEATSAKMGNENSVEEYPKLRRPKPETLLKIQTHQKICDNIMVVKDTAVGKNMEVPLRREFINKKEQLEQATSDLVKKYEQQQSRSIFNADSNDAQPLALHPKLDLQLHKNMQMNIRQNKTFANTSKHVLTNCEEHLINIFHTKVKAHSNGFFAENLPLWYKETFEKDLPLNWLELMRASDQFEIENVQNKIVLYTKQINDRKNIDLINVSGDKVQGSKENDCFVGFVRYRHLQKSLKDYNKNAERSAKKNENFK